MPCFTVPCRAVSYLALPCRAVPCRAVPCRAVPCRAVPCRAVPCRAVPCRAVPCLAVPSARFMTQKIAIIIILLLLFNYSSILLLQKVWFLIYLFTLHLHDFIYTCILKCRLVIGYSTLSERLSSVFIDPAAMCQRGGCTGYHRWMGEMQRLLSPTTKNRSPHKGSPREHFEM